MFSLLSLILGIATESDEADTQKELETCYGKLAWYKEHFGDLPEEIDYLAYYRNRKYRAVTEDDHLDVLNGKAAIEDVALWGTLGWQKDLGTFYLSNDAILFSGKKVQKEIPYSDVVSVTQSEGTLSIRTRSSKTWSFDSKELARYGVDSQTIKGKIK